MPKKVRLDRLRLVTSGAGSYGPQKPKQPTATGLEEESNFRILRAVLPPSGTA